MNKQQLVVELYEIGVLQFGSFTLKSGLQSPFYLDFRRIISYPDLLKAISEQLWAITENLEFDHLCGVPYAALSLASTMSVMHQKPLIIKRKEAKRHGTKKTVEGIFERRQRCIVVDDVISSGISMIETLEALEQEGLVIEHILAIVDRMQGGAAALAKHGYVVHSLYTMKEVLDILFEQKKIDQPTYNETLAFVQNNQINFEELRAQPPVSPKARRSYELIQNNAKHPSAKRLLEVMTSKKTNLCCSADVTSAKELLALADAVGTHICMLKSHIDNLSDFDESFAQKLRAIADKHRFLLLEDRKFADIGHIVMQQFTSAPFRISDWADAVTVHVVAGASCIEALKATQKLDKVGLIVIAEMSTHDTLTSADYTMQALAISQQHSDVVLGIVAQERRPQLENNLLLFTPGIHASAKGDKHGQTYNLPAHAIKMRGVDVMIVGRGIYQSENPAATAAEYQKIGWESYLQRLQQD